MQDIKEAALRAEALLEADRYVEAYEAYEAVTETLLGQLAKTKNVRRGSKIVGWGAALLTGGLGLEDLVVVPLVNKAVMKLLGLNLNEALDLLRMATANRLLLLQLSNDVLHRASERSVLLDFQLAFQLTNEVDDGMLDQLFDLVNPLVDSSPVTGAERNRTVDALMLDLKAAAQKKTAEAQHLADLLFLYLLLRDLTDNRLYEALRVGRENIEASFRAAQDAEAADIRDKAKTYARVLGLEGKVTRSDIKRLYREKIMACHPDRMPHASEAEIREAHERASKLNEAYAYFKQKYRF